MKDGQAKGIPTDEEEIFKLAELLADEAFGKHGVNLYSERQVLTVAFNKILQENSRESRKEPSEENTKL